MLTAEEIQNAIKRRMKTAEDIKRQGWTFGRNKGWSI